MQNQTVTAQRANQSLATSKLSELQKEHLSRSYQELAKVGTEYPSLTTDDVAVVAKARAMPIRSMDPAYAIGGITKAVQYVAKHFGARDQIEDEMLNECLREVRQMFGDLGIEEIVHAYRLWAASRFEALEMYGGQFNVTQLARVLAGYKKYREGIKQELARQESITRKIEQDAERERQHQERYAQELANFPTMIEQVKASGSIQRVQKVPVHWYDYAERYEMIDLAPGEKAAFCRRAKDQVLAEQHNALAQAKGILSARSMREHFASIGDAPFWIRGKQYILWAKVLGRELPSFEDQDSATEEE